MFSLALSIMKAAKKANQKLSPAVQCFSFENSYKYAWLSFNDCILQNAPQKSFISLKKTKLTS